MYDQSNIQATYVSPLDRHFYFSFTLQMEKGRIEVLLKITLCICIGIKAIFFIPFFIVIILWKKTKNTIRYT